MQGFRSDLGGSIKVKSKRADAKTMKRLLWLGTDNENEC